MALTMIPKQRYNVSHPEKNGQNFEQIVKNQKYTTFSSLNNVADEIDGEKRGKNVVHEYTENNICFIDRRYRSHLDSDGNEIFETDSEKKFETAEEIFRDFCNQENLKIPNNNQKFRDNLDSDSGKTNQTIAEQFMFAMDKDYAEQIGWHTGMKTTPEVMQWAGDQMNFFKEHFGYKGLNNVLVAYLHLDEDAPHLQILYVPMSDYERKPIADKEPARDKNGDIKYILKAEFAKPRKKYITLPESLTAEQRAERLSQIEQDENGQPVMKMKQVRKTTVDENGKTHSWVPVSHDASGYARYETRHTGVYRIGSTAMWQGFLAERKEDMRQRGIPVPEPYIDNQGRNQMKAWNALQDVYQEEVGSKWGLDRGRVGSHGKGDRPSALTADEKRQQAEQRAEIAKQRAKDAEVEADQTEKLAQQRVNQADFNARSAEQQSKQRIRTANQQANNAEQEANQRKEAADKERAEAEQRQQAAKRAKAEADKHIADVNQQAQENWNRREKARRKKLTDATDAELAMGQLQAENVRGEAQAKLDAAKAYESNVQALTSAVLPQDADPSAYCLLTLNPEQDLKPVALKKGFYQVSAEQLEQWQQEGKALFAGAQANQELLRLLDPADLEQRFQAIYAARDQSVAMAKASEKRNVDAANRKTATAKQREQRAKDEAAAIRQTDTGKLLTAYQALEGKYTDLQDLAIGQSNRIDSLSLQLAAEDKNLCERYQKTGDRNDYDTWTTTHPIGLEGKQSVQLLDSDTRTKMWGVLDGHVQQKERRAATMEKKANHLEQVVQSMKEKVQEADHWLQENHPKAHELLHKTFPKLQETFGLTVQPVIQPRNEVDLAGSLQRGAEHHDQNRGRGTGQQRRRGGPHL